MAQKSNPGAPGGATGAQHVSKTTAAISVNHASPHRQCDLGGATPLREASVSELVFELGAACRRLPDDAVALICSRVPRIIRRTRGEPPDMDAAPFCPCREGPQAPDFLKVRDDWIDDLVRAWCALGPEDRAAFLSRVPGKRAK